MDKRSLMRHAKIHTTNKPSKVVLMLIYLIFAGAMLAEILLSTSGSLMRHAKIHATNNEGCLDANFFNFFAGVMLPENLLWTNAP